MEIDFYLVFILLWIFLKPAIFKFKYISKRRRWMILKSTFLESAHLFTPVSVENTNGKVCFKSFLKMNIFKKPPFWIFQDISKRRRWMILKSTFSESAHLFTPISVKKTNGFFLTRRFRHSVYTIRALSMKRFLNSSDEIKFVHMKHYYN